MTLQEILDDIVHKLDWRGPSGKSMGHIVLSREEACALVHDIGKLQLALQQIAMLTEQGHKNLDIILKEEGTPRT